ncbi:MAG TPA: sigma-70 family RNA polymerase sigma factor [Polyangiaceae bacterium]|nr:sigma-70 family RNA polymerase sigma factor [Polyangiaceae bacterium]
MLFAIAGVEGSMNDGDNHEAESGENTDECRAQFTNTYLRERRFLLNLVRRLGVPQADLEDAVQDVFLVLHTRFRQIERGPGLRFWLTAVAIRICQRRRRSSARRRIVRTPESARALEELVDTRQRPPDESSAENEQRRLLAAAVAQLDDNKQQVFILAELEQRTGKEIAALTRVSRNTVASRLRIARCRVMYALRDRGFERQLG